MGQLKERCDWSEAFPTPIRAAQGRAVYTAQQRTSSCRCGAVRQCAGIANHIEAPWHDGLLQACALQGRQAARQAGRKAVDVRQSCLTAKRQAAASRAAHSTVQAQLSPQREQPDQRQPVTSSTQAPGRHSVTCIPAGAAHMRFAPEGHK